MTVLNRPSNDGDYPTLRSILKVLIISNNDISKKDLLACCGFGLDFDTGENLDKVEITRPRETVNTWKRLGLLEEDNEKINVKKTYWSTIKNQNELEEKTLQLMLMDVLLTPKNNQSFWDKEGGGSSDFTRGACFLLARDIFDDNVVYPDFVENEIIESLKSNSKKSGSETTVIIQNKERFGPLLHWMHALGLMNTSHIADPTLLVNNYITSESDPKTYKLSEFIKNLGKKYPILDTGEYRKKVEGELEGPSFNLFEQKKVSISLSASLERLKLIGLIELENKSDADKLTFTLKGLKNGPDYSHITVKGE